MNNVSVQDIGLLGNTQLDTDPVEFHESGSISSEDESAKDPATGRLHFPATWH